MTNRLMTKNINPITRIGDQEDKFGIKALSYNTNN